MALKVGKALATYLNYEGTVVIGFDTRTTNKMLEQALTAGLVEGGIDVIKLNMVPTPLVGYATEKLGADAGVMITASHNPSQYNGIKLWNANGMAYTPEQEKEIEDLYYSEEFGETRWDHIGSIVYNEGSEISPIAFRKAGCNVITLNSQVDGFFPGRNPEPNDANLGSLKKAVVATGSDLGIAHDGDADRMITVDETGKVSDFDKLLALISKGFGGTVVTTVDAGICMDEAMAEVGGKVVRTPVGDVSVAKSIIEEDAKFGGEPSGTWLHPDFCMCPDGLLSGLRIAELVSHEGKLSELLSQFNDYPHKRDKVTCSKEAKVKVMENMEDLLKDAFDDIENINTIDGVRITFDDGSWVLVRPSGTEDYVRITLEAKTEERAEFISKTCKKIIEANI